MFSKKDYESYFQQLAEIEFGMAKRMDGIIAEVKDEQIRAALTSIYQDELRHAKLVVELRRIVTQAASS